MSATQPCMVWDESAPAGEMLDFFCPDPHPGIAVADVDDCGAQCDTKMTAAMIALRCPAQGSTSWRERYSALMAAAWEERLK